MNENFPTPSRPSVQPVRIVGVSIPLMDLIALQAGVILASVFIAGLLGTAALVLYFVVSVIT